MATNVHLPHRRALAPLTLPCVDIMLANIGAASGSQLTKCVTFLQVGLIVWGILIACYLGRATRSLQKRPYAAFRFDL